ncbi:hypothetical protein BELL_0031g00180 [Botrytis elliptica]|uniref:Uncharacterized protein n=1 Tax=Botrytis elliptica TaxID=278938 RepID=A0A4Z1KE42_9HELO|nr:hypothetical protein BELL_0031g00180 [Botrytis elliptica]
MENSFNDASQQLDKSKKQAKMKHNLADYTYQTNMLREEEDKDFPHTSLPFRFIAEHAEYCAVLQSTLESSLPVVLRDSMRGSCDYSRNVKAPEMTIYVSISRYLDTYISKWPLVKKE